MAIALALQRYKDPQAYAFVRYGVPCINLAKNLKAWGYDEMKMGPERFARKVAGIISHESLHVVLDQLLNDRFDTSSRLDFFFGKVYSDDDSVHGLWDLNEVLRVYANFKNEEESAYE